MRCTYNMPFSSKLLTLQGNGKHSDASFVMLYHIPDLEPNRRQKICPVAKGLKNVNMNCGIKDRFVSIYIKLKDAYESDIHIYEGKDDINIDKFKKGFNYGQKKALLKNCRLWFSFLFLPSILFIIAGPVLPFPSPFQPPPSFAPYGGVLD